MEGRAAKQRTKKHIEHCQRSCPEWYELLFVLEQKIWGLVCVDNDPEPLDYSRETLLKISPDADIRFVKDNVLKMALRNEDKNKKKYGMYHMVYSVGLHDHLAERTLVPLLNAEWDLVKTGGKLILSFKDKDKYQMIGNDGWVIGPMGQKRSRCNWSDTK